MTDQPSFPPFPVPQEAAPPMPKDKKQRNRRERAAPVKKEKKLPVAQAPAKQPRKPRVAKARPLMIDAAVLHATVGMKAEDIHLLGQFVQAMNGVKKKSRAKLVSALGQMFK